MFDGSRTSGVGPGRRRCGRGARGIAREAWAVVGVEADWKWRVGLLGRQVVVERTDGTTITGRLHEMSFTGLELDTGEELQVIVPETVRHIWSA